MDLNIQDIDGPTLISLQKADAIISALQKGEESAALSTSLFGYSNGIFCKNQGSVLPRVLISAVLKIMHDGPTGGHFGLEKTLAKVKTIGWLPSMLEDVRNWIKSCPKCQVYKTDTRDTEKFER